MPKDTSDAASIKGQERTSIATGKPPTDPSDKWDRRSVRGWN